MRALGADPTHGAGEMEREFDEVVRAIYNGVTIAHSDDTILVEGNHYFPLESVERGVLRQSRMKSLCPWKGMASYYHVEAGGERSCELLVRPRPRCPLS